jgi:meso-butanediol dehydrogenase/(S,S)-butanediol dehydrogenase/diacetyl reductase
MLRCEIRGLFLGEPCELSEEVFVNESDDCVQQRMKTKRFENKSVLITGGSRGIGKGLAQRFSAEGAALTLAANEDAVLRVAEEINDSGGRAVAVVCDVTSKADVEKLFDRAVKEHGQLDVSIQNAGVITIAKIEDLTEAEWDKIMAVNTKGVFLCCQAAAVRMKPESLAESLTQLLVRPDRDSFTHPITPLANSVSWASPKAWPKNSLRSTSP